jgi:L-aspartate oxidase
VVHGGRVVGCRLLDDAGGAETTVLARATLLATGGAGQVFAETTNPAVATGDGMAMGLRAGAALLDMEFVQFHPTALAVPGAPRFLVSEAVRGEGAYLRNARGERFTDELGPRDQVARAIAREDREGRGPVTLDLRHLDAERVRTRFPRIAATCARYGIDIASDPVPVAPAAHYVMGGVATDLHGRSTLPGLYAAGEVAGNGVHGANRLASNSLLEGLVFGARAAEAMAGDGNQQAPDDAGTPGPVMMGPPGPKQRTGMRQELRDRAWAGLGLERNATGLKDLLDWLDTVRRDGVTDPADRVGVDVAWAMATSALFREESRGAHFRTDFPRTDDARFHGHTLLDEAGPRLVDAELPSLVHA